MGGQMRLKRKVSLIFGILFSAYSTKGEDVIQMNEDDMVFKDKKVSILFDDTLYELPSNEPNRQIGFNLSEGTNE